MAEQPQDSMSREIEEELRRERLLKLWDKYGVYVLGAVVALVAGVGGWQYFHQQRVRANETASTKYVIALTDLSGKKTFEGQKTLEELAAQAPAGYATLARLRLAASDAAEGNAAEALAAFDQIANDKSIDPLLADLARLQSAMLKFDSATFTELRNQLSPLATDKSPWRYSARELLGLGAAKADRPEEARTYFQRLLGDSATPPGILARARVMVALLDEQDRAKTAPAATEKSETPAKVEPSQAKDDKGKGAPGGKKAK